jgi:hypothetical protein
MEVQQMDVDVLSQAELSKLNDAMNEESQLGSWITRARLAEEDVDKWNKLNRLVIFELSAQLSTTSNRDLFSCFTSLSCAEYQEFMDKLKGDELKKWNEGVLMGVKKGNWGRLVMHRTSLPLAV